MNNDLIKNEEDFNMELFIRNFEESEQANWMAVHVQIGDNHPEIIFNPKENFAAKMEYYQNAYTPELTLKANPDIRIVGFLFAESFEDFVAFYKELEGE